MTETLADEDPEAAPHIQQTVEEHGGDWTRFGATALPARWLVAIDGTAEVESPAEQLAAVA